MSGNDGERLRVATYNVHGCRGMDARRSENRIAEVIAALDVEVIGLQELDLNLALEFRVGRPELSPSARGSGGSTCFPALPRPDGP